MTNLTPGRIFEGGPGRKKFSGRQYDQMRWRSFCRPVSRSGPGVPRVIQSLTMVAWRCRVMTGRVPTSRANNRRVWMSPGSSSRWPNEAVTSRREDVHGCALQPGQYLLKLLDLDALPLHL